MTVQGNFGVFVFIVYLIGCGNIGYLFGGVASAVFRWNSKRVRLNKQAKDTMLPTNAIYPATKWTGKKL